MTERNKKTISTKSKKKKQPRMAEKNRGDELRNKVEYCERVIKNKVGKH